MLYLMDTNLLLRSVAIDSPMYFEAMSAIQNLRVGGNQLHIVSQNLIEWNVYTRPLERNGFGRTVVEDTSAGTGLVSSMVKPLLEDKQAYYRQIITEEMKQAAHAPMNGEIQTIVILDPVGDHYQLLDLGWDDADRRVFQPIIHVDLIGTKVWIQENTTDLDISKVFVKSGVDASDIVLGLHSRSLRQLSDYALE
jgi:hypothetical protein